MKGAGSTLEAPRSAPDGKLREENLMAALPARSANREVKVGLFVLIGILAFLVALFSLTDVGTFRGRYYVGTVIENAGGMRNGDPVQMRGVNIGRVTEFGMVPEGVAVKMEIYDRYEIPEDSRVEIKSAGLLGGMLVSIVPGTSTERADDDQMLPGSVEADIMSTAGTLSTQAEDVLGRATTLLSQETIGTVGETVGSVGASAAELELLLADLTALAANQRQELALLSASLRRSAGGVEAATTGPELQSAIANVDALTARLDQTSATLSTASTSLETVLGRLERGEGTLGKLTTDDALYNNLNSAATSLQQLVTDIRADPRRYLNVSVF
jgi:phospholipid/cholesterol/gamma-HCH transport system substrate-binding protein